MFEGGYTIRQSHLSVYNKQTWEQGLKERQRHTQAQSSIIPECPPVGNRQRKGNVVDTYTAISLSPESILIHEKHE